MTILHSFCCWRSIRKGSYACGVYSAIYYTVITAHTSYVLKEEVKYLRNASQESYIDHDITSNTTALFGALIVASSSCGIVSALLLLFGIYKNLKVFLIPWIFNMMVFILVDLMYVIFSLIVQALQWNPTVAILVTVDLFLNALNSYALLCVISQYQEFKAGRGRSRDNLNLAVPNIQYSCTQPTGTSGASSRGRPTQWRPTPSQSPTAAPAPAQAPAGGRDEPPGGGGCAPPAHPAARGPRKSVKFPEHGVTAAAAANGARPETWGRGGATAGADTAPLLDAVPAPP